MRAVGSQAYLRAPASLGVAHAPALDEGALADTGLVGYADWADHEVQEAFLDVHIVVPGLVQRQAVVRGTTGEGLERSLTNRGLVAGGGS